MQRWWSVCLCLAYALVLAGCPKDASEYRLGRQSEALKDYDTALVHYQKALNSDPQNASYRVKVYQMRLEVGQYHVGLGRKARAAGDLQLALAEFQKAFAIDPSSSIAEQEARATLDMINRKAKENEPPPPTPSALAEMPPQIIPLSNAPINLHLTNDAKIVFETVGKLAGLTVVFDAEYPARRISADLNNVSLSQALDIVALESKSFWKPLTQNIIFVTQDQPTKRRDYEDQVIRTFYLSNTVQPQELTEIVAGLRQLLDLKRILQLNSQNALVVRDTPDKLAIIEKLLSDVDKAKPEVIIQVEVLQARLDRLRELGVLPGQSSTLAFTPAGTASSSSSSTTTTPSATGLPLNQLHRLSTGDYSITLPGATATAIMTDTTTKIIQNPEIRCLDGQTAKLKIGDRIPIATGSFQAGGLVGAGASGIVNPLVNTQFTYQDTGVNIDVTPRVHPNREVSLKITVDVSSVTGEQPIGGIQQPIISQRKSEQEIRLKEGEVSVLGGMIDRTDTRTLNGWPYLSRVPFFRYLTSDEKKEIQENEVLIVLIPKIVRLPEWTRNMPTPVSTGSEAQVQVRRQSDIETPKLPPQSAPPPQNPNPAPNPPQAPTAQQARLRFEPASQTLKVGQTVTLAIVVENVQDLFSIPMLLQYNPAVLSVEEVKHGGFLSGGTQEIAIVQNVNKERGQAIISATRQPNTPGVSGSGTLLGIVVRALAPGASSVAIVQVNAKDSQQKAIPLVTGEAAIQVTQ